MSNPRKTSPELSLMVDTKRRHPRVVDLENSRVIPLVPRESYYDVTDIPRAIEVIDFSEGKLIAVGSWEYYYQPKLWDRLRRMAWEIKRRLARVRNDSLVYISEGKSFLLSSRETARWDKMLFHPVQKKC